MEGDGGEEWTMIEKKKRNRMVSRRRKDLRGRRWKRRGR